MVVCAKCRKREVEVSAGEPLCRPCFIERIDTRIRKGVFQTFHKNDRVYVLDPFCRYLLGKAVKGLPLQYVNSPEQAQWIIIPHTADDLAVLFLQQMAGDGLQKKDPQQIWLLATVTDREMLQYSQFVGLPFTPQQKDPRFSGFFVHLTKYPEIKNKLSKNYQALLSQL